MSSLSAKVKDLLSSSGESKQGTQQPEGTQHPPGSFPTEEMEPSETQQGYSKKYEQEHNKLHKPDDPRGWTEGDNTARGHGYKDSGVGLTESSDPTSYKPSQDPISEGRNDPLERRDNPLEKRNDPLERRDDPLERRNDPLERTTESTTAGGLGDNTNLASREGTDPTGAGRLGDNTNLPSQEGATGSLEPSTQEHPYWGDLPAGGAGVHNTVVGHGSPEDEARRHRAVHSGATEPAQTSAPLESGTFPTTQRRGHETSYTTTNPHDAQRQAQQNPHEGTSGSHFKEGAAGAGAVGAGALGAHEINKRRTAEETPSKADQTTTQTQPEEHKGRSFPLLGHKDKDTHTKEEKHKEEKHKEEKHKEPKQESKLGALFHRRGSKSEKEPKTEQEPVKDKHHDSKAAPALAAAGAAGAGGATYAATRDRHGDDTQRDPTASSYQDPSATRGTGQYSGAGLGSTQGHTTQGSHPITGPTQQSYQQDDSHRGAGLATGAAAGLGAGALASHHGQRSHDDRTGLDSNRGYDAQRTLPTEHSTTNPAVHSTTNPAAQSYQKDDSHRGAGLATGAAAGLGAGALASHHGQRSHDDRTGLDSNPAAQSYQQQTPHAHGISEGAVSGYGTSALPSQSGLQHTSGQPSALGSTQGYDAQRSQPPANFSHKDPVGQTHQEHDSHRGAGLAAGTAAGLGAGALASRSGRDHQTEPGQQYSGLDANRGFESQGNQPIDRSVGQTTAQPHHQQDSHRGAGLGAGTAAGLGAGALASRSGRDHQSEPSHSGLDPLNRDESHSSYSTERSTRDPTAQSHQHEGSHHGAGLASGTAAGVGAGALASHELNKRHEKDQYPTEQGSRGLQSGTTGTGKYDTLASGTPSGYGTSATEQAGRNTGAGKYDHLASGTASGIAPSGNQPLTGTHSQSQRSTEGTHGHHTLEENANAGKYNTLASGTPSGVAYDDDLDNTRSTQRADTNIPQSKDHHYGTTAAGLGAAAAGAGGAAALSRNRDEKPIERQQEPLRQTEPQTERSLDRQTETKQPLAGGVASALSNNKPVIHKCQKCGEDNDISKYFTSNSGKI